MRKALVVAWLCLLTAGICVLFWVNEWKYSLPTPIPVNYHTVKLGSLVTLPASASNLLIASHPGHNTSFASLGSFTMSGDDAIASPIFIHFFNPECPCSRFNMPQFRSLVQQFGQQVIFGIVVLGPKHFTSRQIQDKFDLPYPIPVFSDSAIAAACGVYSTPQAVIIDPSLHLYYRGNYNRSRYCSDDKTSFARQAIDSLLHHNYSQAFSPLALKAYGCQLPSCTQ